MKTISSLSLLLTVYLVCITQTVSDLSTQPPFHELAVIQPQDTKLSRLYIAILDRSIDTSLPLLDPVTLTLDSDPLLDRKRIQTADPLWLLSQSSSLKTVRFTESLAYAYTIPYSKYYQSQEILKRIEAILERYISTYQQVGAIGLPAHPIRSVETALHLESFIMIHMLLGQKIDRAVEKRFEAFLNDYAEFLYHFRFRTQSTESMIGCAALALCGHHLKNSRYRQEADAIFEWLHPLIHKDGSADRLTGHDIYRTTLFLKHFFTYSLITQNDEYYQTMARMLRWYTKLMSYYGIPLTSFSNIPEQEVETLTSPMIGPLAFYAEHDSSFSQFALRYLESAMNADDNLFIQQGSFHFLLGAMAHRYPASLRMPPYDPYFFKSLPTDESFYLLVGKNYQTALTIQSQRPFLGIQAWSYRGEPPLIYPTMEDQTGVQGMGYSSNDIEPLSYVIHSHQIPETNQTVDIITVQYRQIIKSFIFSNDTTVVVFRQFGDIAWLNLIRQPDLCPPIEEITGGMIRFKGMKSKILFPSQIPPVDLQPETIRIQFQFNSPFCWYSLAGPQSYTFIKPVQDGLVFVHINESNQTLNFLLNMSASPFTLPAKFPGTEIPIPPMAAWDSKRIQTELNR